MATLGERFIKTSLIYYAIIATILMLGCIDMADKRSVEIIPISTPVTSVKTDTLVYNSSDGTLTRIIKLNDYDIMFDINVQLLCSSNEESKALIMVDNSPYQVPYNTEKMIKDHIIRITAVDNTTQSVRIIVKRVE